MSLAPQPSALRLRGGRRRVLRGPHFSRPPPSSNTPDRPDAWHRVREVLGGGAAKGPGLQGRSGRGGVSQHVLSASCCSCDSESPQPPLPTPPQTCLLLRHGGPRGCAGSHEGGGQVVARARRPSRIGRKGGRDRDLQGGDDGRGGDGRSMGGEVDGRGGEKRQAPLPSPPLTVTSAQGVFSPSSVIGSGSLTPASASQRRRDEAGVAVPLPSPSSPLPSSDAHALGPARVKTTCCSEPLRTEKEPP